MSYSLYRRTRSARLTVTTAEGEQVRVENMTGDDGFSLSFAAKRTMSDKTGEFAVTAWNLPDDALGVIEFAQASQVDDTDRLLVGQTLYESAVPADGSAALAAGYLVVELEAGYDGTVSRVFRAVGARVRSRRPQGDLDDETTIEASENLDGILLGLPLRTFPTGATLFEVVDYLRLLAGLGPGNLDPATLAALIGEATLDSPYHVSAGDALGHLRETLQFLPLRWFVDDRELWICGRDDVPNPGGIPPFVVGEVLEPDLLLSRPERDDAGRVRIECLLCPRLLPGRLLRLSPGGLLLALEGLSPSAVEVALARVPPGLYRIDEVEHRGSTSGEEWTTTALLRPGVAGDLL